MIKVVLMESMLGTQHMFQYKINFKTPDERDSLRTFFYDSVRDYINDFCCQKD